MNWPEAIVEIFKILGYTIVGVFVVILLIRGLT